MALLREDGSLVQWLHVSKYPPSVTYDALELGIAWLLLALFLVWRPPAWADAVLRPLGQSAFFFYLLHAHLLAVAGRPPHARDGAGDDLPVGGGGDRGAGPGLQRVPEVQGRPSRSIAQYI